MEESGAGPFGLQREKRCATMSAKYWLLLGNGAIEARRDVLLAICPRLDKRVWMLKAVVVRSTLVRMTGGTYNSFRRLRCPQRENGFVSTVCPDALSKLPHRLRRRCPGPWGARALHHDSTIAGPAFLASRHPVDLAFDDDCVRVPRFPSPPTAYRKLFLGTHPGYAPGSASVRSDASIAIVGCSTHFGAASDRSLHPSHGFGA